MTNDKKTPKQSLAQSTALILAEAHGFVVIGNPAKVANGIAARTYVRLVTRGKLTPNANGVLFKGEAISTWVGKRGYLVKDVVEPPAPAVEAPPDPRYKPTRATDDQRRVIARWLFDRVSAIKAGSEHIERRYAGFDFVGALEAVMLDIDESRQLFVARDDERCGMVFRHTSGGEVGFLHENDGEWRPEFMGFLVEYFGGTVVFSKATVLA